MTRLESKALSSKVAGVAASTIALAFAAGVQRAGAEEFTLRIGSGHPPVGLGYVIAAKDYFQPEVTRRVAAHTKHTIKWVEAYGGTIAKLSEMTDAVRNGLLDIGAISQPFDPAKYFLHNLPSYIPFQESDPLLALRAMRRVHDEIPWFKEVYEKQWNQRLLGIGAQATYGMGTKFAWEKFEDLKGRKLSAAGPNLPWLSNTGATPVQTNLNEAYNALQSGVYDGLVIFPAPWYGFKLHETAKHFKLVNFGSVPWNSLTINLNTARRLPPEVMRIIEDTAKQYEIASAYIELDRHEQAKKQLAAAGSTVTELPEAERAKWAAALKDLPNTQAQEAKKRGMPGPQALRLYIQALKDQGYKFPYEYEIKD
jgi:TRAP-type C4-dicarboxylate transport system substrate-binding protein